jgi:WD40 repeat protein
MNYRKHALFFSYLLLFSVTLSACMPGAPAPMASAASTTTIGSSSIQLTHLFKVLFATICPNGKYIATVSANLLNIWDAANGSALHIFSGSSYKKDDSRFDPSIEQIAFSPNSTLIANTAKDKTLRIWNLDTGKTLLDIKTPDRLNSLAFNRSCTHLATASEDDVLILNADNGQHLHIIEEHNGLVYEVAYSPDGLFFATASKDRTVRVWTTTTYEPVHIFELLCRARTALFSFNSQLLAAYGKKTVYLLDLASKKLRNTFTHFDSVTDIKISPDNRVLATTVDKTAHIWDINGPLMQQLTFADPIDSLEFSPLGKLIVCTGKDHMVQVHTLRRKQMSFVPVVE